MTDITELAQREKFEAWFKSSFHPDKTGPYIKDQLYFAWKAAGAELVEALEKAQESNEFLKGQLSELANFNPDWDKLEASYDSWREIAAELLVAKERIAELESRAVTDWIEHDGKWRPESLGPGELVYLKTRKQELKIPYPAGKVKGWMNTGGDMDVMAYKLASPQASTVTVKLPTTMYTEFEGDDFCREVAVLEKQLVIDCLAAAGIKWEAE